MKISDIKKLDIPVNPGVYFFVRHNHDKKEILYIGKATSLRDRTKSYFAADLIATRGPMIVDMVTQSETLEWQETDSVLEALILEAQLIKKYQPKYNTKEKDNKSFNYVVITDEDIPRVLLVRGRSLKIADQFKTLHIKYTFGPFPSGTLLKEALKIIRKIFPFVDTQSAKEDNAEFYRQIGLSPEIKNSDARDSYKKTIRHIKLFFEGKKKTIIADLQKDMMRAAKAYRFEDAQLCKKKIFALEHINDVALLKNDINETVPYTHQFRIEAFDVAHMSGKSMVGVMTVVVDGVADKTLYRKFIIRSQAHSNDTGALEEVLVRRFRHTEWGLPDIVLVDGALAQRRVAERVLKMYKLDIPVLSVVKDEKHRPKGIEGDKLLAQKYEPVLLLANSEAHRFAITFHKLTRAKKFLS